MRIIFSCYFYFCYYTFYMLFRAFYWLILALLLSGMLLRLNLGGTGLLPHDLLLPLYALSWLFWRVLIVRHLPRGGRFLLPAVGFLVIGLVGYFFSHKLLPKEILLSFAHWMRFFSMIIFAWSTGDIFKNHYHQYWRGVIGISALVIVLGFVQYFVVPDIGTWSKAGQWDPHIGRLLGTWMDPNFMAGFIAFWLSLSMGIWYSSKGVKSFFMTIFVALLAMALSLTFSRSGYLSAGVGLVFFFLFRDWRVLVAGALMGVVGVTVIMNNDQSRLYKRVNGAVTSAKSLILSSTDEVDPTANLRLQSWQKSLELWKKSPVVGIGFSTYRYKAAAAGVVEEGYFSAGGSDSSLLNVLITSGILGFLCYCLWLFILFWKQFSTYITTKNSAALGWAAGLIALSAHSFFVNSLLDPFIMLIVLGSWYALSHWTNGKDTVE